MTAMNTTRSTYQVHAELREMGTASTELDDDKAGHPLERRLNRIERVAAAFRGTVEKRLGKSLQMVFTTADAALLAACEMQHRCAVLPQVSANKLALRIGIHQEMARQRSKDSTDNAMEISSLLAMLDDGVVASDIVVAALSPELRQLAQPLSDLSPEMAVHRIDWRCEIPSAAYGGESLWPVSIAQLPGGPHLVLHHGLKTLELTAGEPVATIGRDGHNDLVLVDNHVSREHCRIEIRNDGIVLTDASTNGTCVTPDQGEERMVRKESVALRGKGMLFFGRRFDGERRGGVRYEAYP